MLRANATYVMTYTHNMVHSAVKTFVWRRGILGQKKLWLAEFALAVLFLWFFARGDRGWAVGLLGATLLAPPILISVVWLAHYRNTVGKFRSMQSPIANLTIGADGLAVASALGSVQIPWSILTEIWERPTYWMFFTAPSQFFTIPIETISTADRDFVRSKVGTRRKTT
jgi:hypothetical protein